MAAGAKNRSVSPAAPNLSDAPGMQASRRIAGFLDNHLSCFPPAENISPAKEQQVECRLRVQTHDCEEHPACLQGLGVNNQGGSFVLSAEFDGQGDGIPGIFR